MKRSLLFALVSILAGGYVSASTVGEGTNIVQAPAALRTVQGTVANEQGEPLAGASVQLAGGRQGTTTDAAGRFQIRVPASGRAAIEVSFLGYASREITLDSETDFYRVVLAREAMKVDEVVVTGMNTISKNDYVGSVVSLQADSIKLPGMSLEQSLQGQVAGLAVTNLSGRVGATPEIRVRGTSTIMGNKNPLWVVDGVVQQDVMALPNTTSSYVGSELSRMRQTVGSAISWLNPDDVETITILKDASATAIYGSAASNGVIVLTTKKATGQGLSVSYSGDYSVGQKPSYGHYDFMNSQEQMRFQHEMWMDRDSYSQYVPMVGFGELIQLLQSKRISEAEYAERFRRMEMQNTDWFDVLMRGSFSQKHNIGISGVGEKINSRFSIGFDRQNSEARENTLQSITASSNSTYRHEDKVVVTLQLAGSYRKTSDYGAGIEPYDYALTTSRTLPVWNDDGSLAYYRTNDTSQSFPDERGYKYNILNEIANTGVSNESMTLNSSINVQVRLLDDLEFRGQASYALASGNGSSYATENSYKIARLRGWDTDREVAFGTPAYDISRLPAGGQLVRDNTLTSNYSLRANLNYNKTLADRHRILVQLGAEATSAWNRGNTDMRYGYRHYRGKGFAEIPYRVLRVLETPVGQPVEWIENSLLDEQRGAATVTDMRDNKISQYLTAIYNYDNRYVVNFNARLDASNRFGQDQNKRFNPGWSLGGKWRAGNDPIMDWAAGWLYNFDVSASYGWRGNAVQSVSPELIASIPDNGGYNTVYNDYTLVIGSLAYPGLGWERKQDWNLGFDFAFFEGRLSMLAEVYGSKSHVMTRREVPAHNGVATALIDGTVIRNSGWELSVTALPVRTDDFSWSLNFNTSRENSRVRNDNIEYDADDYIDGTYQIDGMPYGTFWAYDFVGLNPEDGTPVFNYISDGYRLPVRTTDPTEFLAVAGKSEPDFYGGLSTNFRYRNWNLNTSFVVSFGTTRFLPSVYPANGVPTPDTNLPLYLNKRWRNPGDELHTDVPSIPGERQEIFLPDRPAEMNGSQKNIYEMYNRSTAQLAKGDYIRCSNIALSYDLPESVLDRIGVRRVALSASMGNPFVIAFDKKWDGRDPESGSWPARRIASLGLNVSF
jgi:TonB-linked SusC/RagA family outer membrane protein